MIQSVLILQQESLPDFSSLWPVTINADGEVIHGRDDAHALIGFQDDKNVQTVNLFTFQADSLEDLAERCIGKYPVFSSKDGSGVFSVPLAVSSAKVAQLDPARLTA